MEPNQTRLVGDYILGSRIGRGSFAVVWRSIHRFSGLQVAVKEIDKKLLTPKVSENLLKEISILSTINHPNIIRFFESIEVTTLPLPLPLPLFFYYDLMFLQLFDFFFVTISFFLD
jgi:serine/threonine protein kinase